MEIVGAERKGMYREKGGQKKNPKNKNPMRLPVAWQPLRSKASVASLEVWLTETTHS